MNLFGEKFNRKIPVDANTPDQVREILKEYDFED